MLSKSVLNRLRQFDAYPKTMEDFRVKTYGGAVVSIISAVIMVTLFASELNYYLTTEIHPELMVDTTRGQQLRININITFPHLPCPYLSIDVMDISGENQLDVFHTLAKTRLNQHGLPITGEEAVAQLGGAVAVVQPSLPPLPTDYCGDCYGAQTPERPCCNTCDEVQQAYRDKSWAFVDGENIEQCKREGYAQKMQAAASEGCQVHGFMFVNKVAGNFHFAPGKSSQQQHLHIHDLAQLKMANFNLTHYIEKLSFGVEYPGQVNPLDGVIKVPPEGKQGSAMYQYFIKVVPTEYVHLNGKSEMSSQFSATSHVKVINPAAGENGLPGVFFMYEPSPMLVKITEKRRSFMHFLTGVCAIVGGVFTVAGLIDSMLYHSLKTLKQKMDIGKQT